MAGEESTGPIHDGVTDLSGHRYLFYVKHHTPHNTSDAQWLESLSQAEEFAIFNEADRFQIANDNGDLFGVRRTVEGKVIPLGTERQVIAEFPYTRDPEPWHGYPLLPLKRSSDNDRSRLPVPNEALRLMVESGWITASQKRRLSVGKHIS